MPDATALDMVEVQPKTGPALSATSDEPQVSAPVTAEPKKEPESPPAEGSEGKTDPKPEDAEPKKDAASEEDGAEESDLPPKFKSQITRQRSLRRLAEGKATAAEQKADAAAANLAKALDSIETLTKAQAAKAAETANKEDPRPSREGYDDPAKYETDLVDWASRRAALTAKAETEKAVADQKAKDDRAAMDKTIKARNDKVLGAYSERKAAFVEDHPDFEELVENSDPNKQLNISIPMADAILNDEDGPAIAYYLGQNPDESERIAKLESASQQVAALGRIAARLAAKPAAPTKPNPIAPLKSGSETATAKSAADESMEEYGARRNRQLANDRRTRMGLAPLN